MLITESFEHFNYTKLIKESAGDLETEVLDVKEFEEFGYEVRREIVENPLAGGPPVELEAAYSLKDGGYIGSEDIARRLSENGIVPELIDNEHTVCSVGFCEGEEKWYGWSHRAMCGFGRGDMLFEERHITSPDKPFVECGNIVIEDMSQARQAACNFANYVA